MRTIHFFLDFDGTITNVDVVDLLLEKHADERWKEAEKQWAAGEIGSRECLSRQIGLVKASPADLEKIADGVTIDPYFIEFLLTAETLGALVTIVSDGFDLLIERILKKSLGPDLYVKALPIYSNRLVPEAGGFKPVFPAEPCEHGCANCKEALVRRLTSTDDNVFFVGDGLSDRYAAKISQLTFAKGKLFDWCRSNGVDCVSYEDFRKISAWLSDNQLLLRKASFR